MKMQLKSTPKVSPSILIVGAAILSGCLDSGSSATQKVNNPTGPTTPPPAAQNSPPSISGVPTTTAMVGNPWAFTPSANDPDGDTLTFEIENKPDWMDFDETIGTLSGLPFLGTEGEYPGIVISATDGQAISALPEFSLTVQNSSSSGNRPPTISGTPNTTVLTGNQYSFRPTASDPDGDSLSFTVANQPSWADFNPNTGRLFGTPATNDAGVFPNIVVAVTDGEASVSMQPFTIEVIAPAPSNRAPSITGSPPTSAVVGQSYAFQPNASDPDGDSLQFSIVGMPAWASFNVSTGRLSGTPGAGDSGDYTGIVISVSDGALSATLPAFAISVSDSTNNAPQISGTPTTSVTVGQAYSFRPTASDPDGDPISFSIQGRPGWAAFNSSTGRLNGTPQQGDVRVYNNIVITVSDGELETSLPAFSIDVMAAATGSATLTWTPPTTNTDGSPLTIVAYKFYYGLADGDYPNEIRVNSPGISSYMIEDLSPNTYYFVATVINSAGIESEFSNMASKTVTPD